MGKKDQAAAYPVAYPNQAYYADGRPMAQQPGPPPQGMYYAQQPPEDPKKAHKKKVTRFATCCAALGAVIN
ncbi:uncharacterized protein RCC_00194 [Ramularia collo-cygni]|uniref:Cysteine-rich transmembrane CYSTM domain-containing protein n=1 Tax=Ramularia collo-cygni TaxID=112498 RepID=A0A2D3UQ61_9PEZI|nr:uncharacterized protein RCC_00194 [Ramularia collo-cygni]CZT14220.1 uncharacterized protein RCC_00194 [Ramularia collo-cygni]